MEPKLTDLKSEDDEPENVLNISVDSAGSVRGRPPIQDQWTRVVDLDTYDVSGKTPVFTIASDLLLEAGIPDIPRKFRSTKNSWEMIFNPSQYWADNPGLTIENQTLSQKRLLQYGKQIS